MLPAWRNQRPPTAWGTPAAGNADTAMYSKITEASSTRVFHRFRLSNSVCIRHPPQNDSMTAFWAEVFHPDSAVLCEATGGV